jgi:xanthine dehydrogenase YagT iron-sulfur-binding subunit
MHDEGFDYFAPPTPHSHSATSQDESAESSTGPSRRTFVAQVVGGGLTLAALQALEPEAALAELAPPPNAAPASADALAEHTARVTLTVNGASKTLDVDTRVTLLDLLRERLKLTGTRKGCDHGQCGACTVHVNGTRINSCLTLAVMHQGDTEGLGTPDRMHPMQAAFVKYDGFQCGYCTPGQICSAVAVLEEIKAGVPSNVTADLTAHPEATNMEMRERMSGNICRCGAYSNIAEAMAEVAGSRA